jgi:hypothetical protein
MRKKTNSQNVPGAARIPKTRELSRQLSKADALPSCHLAADARSFLRTVKTLAAALNRKAAPRLPGEAAL